MVFALDMDDGTLLAFASVAEAVAHCKAVDVEDKYWRFYSEDGSPLEVRFEPGDPALPRAYTLERAMSGLWLQERLPTVSAVSGCGLATVGDLVEMLRINRGKRAGTNRGSSTADAGQALREIALARQHPGEPRRRWFTSSNIDLFVWVDEAGAPVGFQLCYDKSSREHALTWTEKSGFSSMAVDGGESRPARYKGSPILVTDGVIDAPRILADFRREAGAVPAEIVRMVEARLGQLAEP